MRITLNRYELKKNWTMGELFINDVFICDTLEPPYRGDDLTNKKVKGNTAIPCGIYKVIMSFSNRFQKVLPEILGVPFFVGIRMHSGNTVDDTEACILSGKKMKEGYIGNSRETMKYINNALTEAFNAKEEIQIEVKLGYY